jgi:hypothetical protein
LTFPKNGECYYKPKEERMKLKELKEDEDRNYYSIALGSGYVIIGVVGTDFEDVFEIDKGVVRRITTDTLICDEIYTLNEDDELTSIELDDERMKKVFLHMDAYFDCRDYGCCVTSLGYLLDEGEE